MSEVKHKEYWITQGEFTGDCGHSEPFYSTVLSENTGESGLVHVIEYSAYLAEKNRADEAERKLRIAEHRSSYIRILNKTIKVLEAKLAKAIEQRDFEVKDRAKTHDKMKNKLFFADQYIKLLNESLAAITELTVKEK